VGLCASSCPASEKWCGRNPWRSRPTQFSRAV